MGGDAAATSKLETFMSSLNTSRDAPEDWSGNEPGEWAPWAFDFFGAPEETQHFVHAIADGEYADATVDEPGNDDLGALASWYVWAALGLFPVTPGEANLALASPLFRSVTITLPDGRHLVEVAPGGERLTPLRPRADRLGADPPRRRQAGVCRRTRAQRPHRDLGHALAARLRAAAPEGPCTSPCRARPTPPGAHQRTTVHRPSAPASSRLSGSHCRAVRRP